MSILIGKAIYSALSGDSTVHSYIGDKIYPIFAPDETLNPFVCYDIKSMNSYYTKDGFNYDVCVIEIATISDNYLEGITISNAVRNVLELINGTYGGVNISYSLLSNVTQIYGIDGYVITLEFTITC